MIHPSDANNTQTKETNNGHHNTSQRNRPPPEHRPEGQPGTGRTEDKGMDSEGMVGTAKGNEPLCELAKGWLRQTGQGSPSSEGLLHISHHGSDI